MTNENGGGSGSPEKENRRRSHRLLCSDLISVRWEGQRGRTCREAAVLEDYSPTGASLSIETRIDPGIAVTIVTAWESFGAIVRRCEWRDRGYFLGIEFDEPRSHETAFVPDHLLDPGEFNS